MFAILAIVEKQDTKSILVVQRLTQRQRPAYIEDLYKKSVARKSKVTVVPDPGTFTRRRLLFSAVGVR
ncbi:hypothetical protein MY3296_009591 [Beauveria thailandica]